MQDCCKDKISLYDIRPEDGPLINAAIGLGEWLAKQPEAAESQRFAIFKVLAFLRNLPNPPPPGLHGEFGFEFYFDDESEDGNDFASWSVGVCRGMFEIFSCGLNNLPEFSWVLCPGDENSNDLKRSVYWIRQVLDPRALVPLDRQLLIEGATWDVAS